MLNKLLLPRGRRRRLCELMVVLNSRTRHCLGIVIHCSMQYTHYPCPDSTYVALLTFTLTVDHSQFIQHFNTVNKSECIKHVVFWMCIECLIMGCCLCTIINTLRICESTPIHTHTLSSPLRVLSTWFYLIVWSRLRVCTSVYCFHAQIGKLSRRTTWVLKAV